MVSPSAPSPRPCFPATSTRPRRSPPTATTPPRPASGSASWSWRSTRWPTARPSRPRSCCRARTSPSRTAPPRPCSGPGRPRRPATSRRSLVRPQVRGDRAVDYFGQLGQGALFERAKRYRRGRDRLQGGRLDGQAQRHRGAWPMAGSSSGAVGGSMPLALYDSFLAPRAHQPADEGRQGARRGRQGAAASPRIREGAAQAHAGRHRDHDPGPADPDRAGLPAPGAATSIRRRTPPG